MNTSYTLELQGGLSENAFLNNIKQVFVNQTKAFSNDNARLLFLSFIFISSKYVETNNPKTPSEDYLKQFREDPERQNIYKLLAQRIIFTKSSLKIDINIMFKNFIDKKNITIYDEFLIIEALTTRPRGSFDESLNLKLIESAIYKGAIFLLQYIGIETPIFKNLFLSVNSANIEPLDILTFNYINNVEEKNPCVINILTDLHLTSLKTPKLSVSRFNSRSGFEFMDSVLTTWKQGKPSIKKYLPLPVFNLLISKADFNSCKPEFKFNAIFVAICISKEAYNALRARNPEIFDAISLADIENYFTTFFDNHCKQRPVPKEKIITFISILNLYYNQHVKSEKQVRRSPTALPGFNTYRETKASKASTVIPEQRTAKRHKKQ